MPVAVLLACLLAVIGIGLTDFDQAFTPPRSSGMVLLSVRTGHDAGASRNRYTPGEDGTYSQNYQDVWVKQLAQHNNWTADTGFFLDLGAYDGIRCSNSALLEKKLGWNGICVEPFPQGFADRRCVLVSRALTNTDGQELHFSGSDQDRSLDLLDLDQGGKTSGSLSVTSISIGSLLDCVKGTASATVPCQGLSGHAAVPDLINFASLDIEGSEASVLETFPWDRFKVAAWVVENAVAQTRSVASQAKVRSLLQEKGYIRAPVDNPGVDDYFVLPEFWHPSLAAKQRRVHPEGSSGC